MTLKKEIITLLNDPFPDANLSAQQKRVVRLSLRGLNNRQIGEKLKLSEGTVRTYMRNLCWKIEGREITMTPTGRTKNGKTRYRINIGKRTKAPVSPSSIPALVMSRLEKLLV